MWSKGKPSLELLKTTPGNEYAVKFLWRLKDQQVIESVILRHEKMTCACISSQVGCPLDCVFCATSKIGFKRNLNHDEIIVQLDDLAVELKRIDGLGAFFKRILFMGMGEPLLNYDAVLQAMFLIHGNEYFNFPEIYLATSGKTPDKIYKLAQDAPFVRLWLSLCAADEHIRAELMPSASSTSINDLLSAGEAYANLTGNPVRINYLMVSGLTDSVKQAQNLINYLKGKPFELQLTRLNLLPNSNLISSPYESLWSFYELINSKGVPTTIFESRGSELMAACGQLCGTLEL